MRRIRVRIRPESAFGTPMRGDTLFGQLCWSARHRFGEDRLRGLLAGYAEGRPFLVVSDAFPAGHLPRPALPMSMFDTDCEDDRKRLKKMRWLPVSAFHKPMRQWLELCVTDAAIAPPFPRPEVVGQRENKEIWLERTQPHNTIHRISNSTRTGEFAPYQMSVLWPASGLLLDVYLLVNESSLGIEELRELIGDVGVSGYGRDASIGHGRFAVESLEADNWPEDQKDADAWMTLAPCAPQGMPWKPERCFWKPFTRFGRHGQAAVYTGRPFKNPVLLADTAAVLTPAEYMPIPMIGKGLGGNGELSRAIPGTVHQGYAPVLGVRLGGEV